MAGKKDEDLPESTMQLVWEFKEAQDEELCCTGEWIEHLNSTYPPAKEDEAAPDTAPGIARSVVELHQRDQLEEAHEDTPMLARAYLDAIQKRKAAISIMMAEFAASHPELLDELNRGL